MKTRSHLFSLSCALSAENRRGRKWVVVAHPQHRHTTRVCNDTQGLVKPSRILTGQVLWVGIKYGRHTRGGNPKEILWQKRSRRKGGSQHMNRWIFFFSLSLPCALSHFRCSLPNGSTALTREREGAWLGRLDSTHSLLFSFSKSRTSQVVSITKEALCRQFLFFSFLFSPLLPATA